MCDVAIIGAGEIGEDLVGRAGAVWPTALAGQSGVRPREVGGGEGPHIEGGEIAAELRQRLAGHRGEDEVAAEAMGIDTACFKLYAFLLSAFVPGVVGGFFARDQGYIEPISVFPLITTITMIVMALFGGKGTIWGPVLGAVTLFVFQELVWARFLYLHQILFGAIIVFVVLLMPRGILGVLQERYRLPRTL
jgi:hypothetical protein